MKKLLLSQAKDNTLYQRRFHMNPYDYLIVGVGLFGAVFAHEAKK